MLKGVLKMADNKLLSLTEIFNQKLFRVPDYQRGFSWQKPHLDDLWEDFSNIKEDKIHYTGLLTVEPVNNKQIRKIEKWQDDLWLIESGLSAYYIVDGQQRLTTLIILINQLLKQFNDDEGINFKQKDFWINKFLYQQYGETYKSYIFGYEKDDPSDEYFKTKILEQYSSTADKVPEQTLYTANLQFSKDFFDKKFRGKSKTELENLFKKVVNKLKFNFYEIDEELDVYVTFETMNNRGKPLSNLELLKNRLIYLTTLLDEDADTEGRLRKDINETWKTVYEYLGKNKDNPLDDDEFLRNHWIIYFKYDRKESASYAKFLLNKQFSAKRILENEIGVVDIKNYIDSLALSVKSWFFLYNPEYSSYEDETKEWLQKLNRLGMSAFPPVIVAAMIKCNEEDLLELLRTVEHFIFLVFRLTQRPSNTKNSHFYRLSNSFYFNKENTTIKKVIEDVLWMTQGEEGSGDNYEYRGWFDLEKFQAYIADQNEKAEGYYSWNGLRYFLYEYELYLQSIANGNQKISWIDFTKRKKEDTIEHIYPQNPKGKSWQTAFKGISKKERKKLLNNLGNLLLLAHSKNSSLQNKSFDHKHKHLNKKGDEVGYFNGSYSEIEVSSANGWTPKEIRERGMKMLNFLENRWDIDLQGWKVTKETLLQLKIEKQIVRRRRSR